MSEKIAAMLRKGGNGKVQQQKQLNGVRITEKIITHTLPFDFLLEMHHVLELF
jgi:hypothetical protein